MPANGSRNRELNIRQSGNQIGYTKGLCLTASLCLYLALATYNLGLPGLHYDEAKEAGVNAVELITNAPLTPFRGASISLGNLKLPLMVQDYIGAINVYLAVPFLKLTGIGVPNLRFLSVLLGLLALLTLERAVSTWVCFHEQKCTGSSTRVPLTWAGLITVALVASSPSFVFWNRQGIFVTNVIQPLCFGFIWIGLRWIQGERIRDLLIAGLLAGLALYGKILSLWVIMPFAVYLLVRSWMFSHRQSKSTSKLLLEWTILASMVLAALIPFILFNVQTQGTITALFSNASQSYYGVDNSAYLDNLSIRLDQIIEVLQGGQFWYLGGSYTNGLAPWLALVGFLTGVSLCWRTSMTWLTLIAIGLVMSLFTISDLFITHYALMHPLIVAVVGIGAGAMIESSTTKTGGDTKISLHKNEGRWAPNARLIIPVILLLFWIGADLLATARYHRALDASGGLADHSDATYTLAYHLRYNGLGAPILLDWGMDAPIRYLTEGTVRPIEIFGYESPSRPDSDFVNRLNLFIQNPDNIYLLHSPGTTVFHGRREAFFDQAEGQGLIPTLEETFRQRDGTPLFELWRVE